MEDHLFDRKSVVHEHELWRHALEHARGEDIECETVRAATQNRPYVPQRQQVMDLTRDGFPNVQTVSEFLTRKKLRRGSVVIVDEAGQLAAKQMLELLSFIRESGGRLDIPPSSSCKHGPRFTK